MIRVAITGAPGRMGQSLLQASTQQPGIALGAAVARPNSPWIGKDAGEAAGMQRLGVTIVGDLTTALDAFDVLVDFSRPDATLRYLPICKQAAKPMVIGTTGFDADGKRAIAEVAQGLGVVFAPNMSVGVNVLITLVSLATKVMGDEADIEIVEAHHRHKVDAPSGTALRLGEAAAEARGQQLADCAVYSRMGVTEARRGGTIDFASIRAGDIVGEHTVLFATAGERIELTHKATSRVNFAHGALRAADWLSTRAAGLYDMQDVLGLRR